MGIEQTVDLIREKKDGYRARSRNEKCQRKT